MGSLYNKRDLTICVSPIAMGSLYCKRDLTICVSLDFVVLQGAAVCLSVLQCQKIVCARLDLVELQRGAVCCSGKRQFARA